MRLLITGAGCPLAAAVETVCHEQVEIRAIDISFDRPIARGIERRAGNIRDSAFLKDALTGVDVILHLDPIARLEDSDALDRASRGTYMLLTSACESGVSKVILGSTLDFFDRLPQDWKVTESWRPRPEPSVREIAPWLAELSAREFTRSGSMRIVCLRFGRIVSEEEIGVGPFDPRWLHLEDAVSAVQQGLRHVMREDHARPWKIFHIVSAGSATKIPLSHHARQTLGYEPVHDLAPAEHGAQRSTHSQPPTGAGPWRDMLKPVEPISTRPLRNIVIFGAGGPVGAAVARELSSSYRLRLTDVRPIAEIAAEGVLQSPGAPLAVPLPAPHECRVVDIRDPEATLAACEGMDAIINCTVVRTDPEAAFRVNTLGAYHVMRGAVAHRIRRVVHTGPQMVEVNWRSDYHTDYDVPGDSPPRPAGELYFHSKYLGQEICRVFAEHYGLEVPVLLFCAFVNPELVGGLHPFPITWEDSARAIRRAVEVRSLPSPYELMNVLGDLPHQKWSNQRAKELLDWQPRDDLQAFWTRSAE